MDLTWPSIDNQYHIILAFSRQALRGSSNGVSGV